MILTDVNVLVYAHREETEQHSTCRSLVESMIQGEESYAVSELVLSGFLRVVTHPRIFRTPSPLDRALAFVHEIREQSNAVLVTPGARHFEIFQRLIQQSQAKGNLVADAYLAALAIESGSEWISCDRDFARFPGLRFRPPQ